MDPTVGDLQRALGDRYRVERELGAGGMATVYLAHDTRHQRLVAIKVLRPDLAAAVGGERFVAEIRTAARLQHPHIVPLHDSGESNGLVYYVMPFLEGESLRDRLRRETQLPVGDAIRLATEVASGLDYAHRHGIVHRDIKPENILLQDGRALIADFGIALAMTRSGDDARITATGMSLGTPQYMSPEQAMGERDISPASDIYSLGCVLYEMLAGEPPFAAPTAQAVIARVMTEEPRPLAPQRRSVPAHVDTAVQTALAKLPADRFATAAQFAAMLQGTSAIDVRPSMTGRRGHPPAWARRAAAGTIALALLAGGTAGGALLRRDEVIARPPAIFSLLAPHGWHVVGAPVGTIALSADGTSLVYAATSDSTSLLMLRRLDESRSTPIAGTEGGDTPIISLDGQTVAFFASGQFRKVAVGGGSPVTLPAPGPLGIPVARQAGGFIANAPDGALSLADGDRFTRIVDVDPAVGAPIFVPAAELPDGRILAILATQAASGPLWLIDPRTGSRTLLIDAPVAGAGHAEGYLAWVLSTGQLYASALDLKAGELRGPAQVIATDVRVPPGAPAHIAFSRNGALAYAPSRLADLVLVDRKGGVEMLSDQPRRYHSPRVSPDGSRIAFDVSAESRDVWVLQLEDGAATRVTFDDDGHDPVWLPDGRSLLYAAGRGSVVGVHRARADGSGRGDSVLYSGVQMTAHSVSPDGREALAARVSEGTGGFDIVRLTLEPQIRAHPLQASRRFSELFPAFSPDGRWIAYVSDESGRPEVYIRSVDGGVRTIVSTGGADEPVWSRDGRELYYRDLESRWLYAAAIGTTPSLRVQSRTRLFDVTDYEEASPHANYDVTPDGRFVFVRQPRATELVYIQNWPELARRRGR